MENSKNDNAEVAVNGLRISAIEIIDLEDATKKRKFDEMEGIIPNFSGPDIDACYFKPINEKDDLITKKKEKQNYHLCLYGAILKNENKT
jgi:hypothetical protein